MRKGRITLEQMKMKVMIGKKQNWKKKKKKKYEKKYVYVKIISIARMCMINVHSVIFLIQKFIYLLKM